MRLQSCEFSLKIGTALANSWNTSKLETEIEKYFLKAETRMTSGNRNEISLGFVQVL